MALNLVSIKITDRELRKIVERLVMSGYPIGTCEKGYYWIESYADLQEAVKSLRKKALSILMRAKRLERSWHDFYQLKLDLKGKGK